MNKPTKPVGRGKKPIKTSQKNIPSRDEHRPFPIVGIGASAGGLEALEQFLGHVPENSGMAFVIIQHLDPTHKGIMPELLQRATGDGGIPGQGPDAGQTELRLRDPPQQGHVHSARRAAPVRPGGAPRPAPPHRFLPALPGRGPAGAEHRRHPLWHGLGRHHGPAGHQGKGGGGAGAGARLGQVRQHAQERHRRRAGRSGRPGRGSARQDHATTLRHALVIARTDLPLEDKDQSALEKVLILLRAKTGHDFSLYKKNTVYRRIERRMGIHQITGSRRMSATCRRIPRRWNSSSRSFSSA